MAKMGFKITDLETQNEIKRVIPPVDFQHILIEGPTGSGKTAGLILPTLEDRLKKGHTIIFFDHKGHEHKKVKLLAKKTGRIDDVVEIGKPHSAYINLLAELDTIRLKELIKQNRSLDAYWSNSAANLAEDIITPLRKLHDIVKHLKQYSFFKEKNIKSLGDLKEYGITLDKKPSFQTLASITSSSEKLIQYRRILSDIPKEFQKLLDQDYLFEDEIKNKRQAFAKICAFEASLQSASRFTLSDDASDVNNGNNGVLQILDNLIASYAKIDYINKDEYTITELMTNNVILIIDTQSFGEDTMKLFLESILKKAVQRLRTGMESLMSVFIDEANRVLFPSIDMHSDVLREAFVELIIAIQNEEQMIYKFSPIVWDSIKSNIKHQYTIDIQHKIVYNDDDNDLDTQPMLLSQDMLIDADYAFQALDKNRANIQKNFLGESDTLPEKFTVIYDLDRFEHESSILIEDTDGRQYVFSYFGEEIVNKAKYTYPAESPTANATSEDCLMVTAKHKAATRSFDFSTTSKTDPIKDDTYHIHINFDDK